MSKKGRKRRSSQQQTAQRGEIDGRAGAKTKDGVDADAHAHAHAAPQPRPADASSRVEFPPKSPASAPAAAAAATASGALSGDAGGGGKTSKKKRRRHRRKTDRDGGETTNEDAEDESRIKNSSDDPAAETEDGDKYRMSNLEVGEDNPLLAAQSAYLSSLPPSVRHSFFSSVHVTPETRSEVWASQAEIGEEMVNKHAWATPDERAMRIVAHFAKGRGVVEIGCGANAYWAIMMRKRGIDVVAFDVSVNDGGRIIHGDGDAKKGGRNRKRRKKGSGSKVEGEEDSELAVSRGGPEVLSREPLKSSGRVLFLCYPDEHLPGEARQDEQDDNEEGMAASCLRHFAGDTLIHVGELISASAPTPSLDQAPWGRSSSASFQCRLHSEYHCVLRAKLPGWLHVKDTISVWRRSPRCEIVFAADSDDSADEDEEVEYRHVPLEERLPVDCAAPCAAHLL